MKRVSRAVLLTLAFIWVASPAIADDAEEGRLTAVPPASLSADVTPVLDIVAPASPAITQTWGLIARTGDLAGNLQRDRAESSERFTLKGDVFFDIDEATLTKKARQELDKIATELGDVELAEIQIDGHTDTVGSSSHNAKLSQNRAESVADYLGEDLKTVEMSTNGYGFKRLLVAEGGTAEEIKDARSRNRRVEITVTYRD